MPSTSCGGGSIEGDTIKDAFSAQHAGLGLFLGANWGGFEDMRAAAAQLAVHKAAAGITATILPDGEKVAVARPADKSAWKVQLQEVLVCPSLRSRCCYYVDYTHNKVRSRSDFKWKKRKTNAQQRTQAQTSPGPAADAAGARAAGPRAFGAPR